MRLIAFSILLLGLSTLHGKNPLIGSWRLDREATKTYLIENRILEEHLIERIFEAQMSIEWRFDEKRIYGGAHEKGLSVPYRIELQYKNKIVLVSKEPDGKEFKSTVWMDSDGQAYWQETDLIKGYRERIVKISQNQPRNDNSE